MKGERRLQGSVAAAADTAAVVGFGDGDGGVALGLDGDDERAHEPIAAAADASDVAVGAGG